MTDGTVTLFPEARPSEAPASDYAATVAACKAEMKAAGLSIAKAAHEMGRGVSQSVLSKWLRGIYEGDVPKVTERVSLWLSTRAEAARRDLAAAGLDRHVDLGVTEEIETALGHAQATGDIVLVHGRAGRGKSWAMERYCAGHTAAYGLAMTEAVQTLSGMLGLVAEVVGAGGGHPSALAAETAIVERLTGRRALLCVDEADLLRPRLLNQLRCIRDRARCGLALLGRDPLWKTVARSERCEPIVGRIGIRLPLAATAEADILDLARGVLSRAPTKAERDHLLGVARGDGGLHALRRLFARAWVLARAGGNRGISAGDIAAAREEAA